MTVWYSDHYGADGDNDITLVYPPKVVGVGIKHARLRYNRAYFKGLGIAADVIRMMTMRSSDRLVDLYISSDGGSDAGAVDVGLYLKGSEHDGAVIDADVFASAQAISTAIERTSILTEATTLQHEDHGKTLWALAAIGAATYTEDPQVLFDICLTVTTTFTTTDSKIVLEAFYTAGD